MQTLRKGKEMTFEEALKAMREGKKVIFKGKTFPLAIKYNCICEFHQLSDGSCYYESLSMIDACYIMRDDWEIVQDDV